MKYILLFSALTFSLAANAAHIQIIKMDQLEAVILKSGEYVRPIDLEMNVTSADGVRVNLDKNALEINLDSNEIDEFLFYDEDVFNSNGIELLATGGDMGGGGKG